MQMSTKDYERVYKSKCKQDKYKNYEKKLTTSFAIF